MKYESYLKTVESLSLEEMNQIYGSIFENANLQDNDFKEYWADVVNAAIEYTDVRAKWSISKPSENDHRSTKHNSLITAILVLERIFKSKEWPSDEWTTKLFLGKPLGERRVLEDVDQHRRRIGDFGNYIVFMQALETRNM